mmetsp:Transcript_8318/g.23829  ORF Transcript_8318/g.23829 Transcript_8318/m.23829 type:complete len:356 (+) Transcript_8318:117-1184(+)
MGCPSAYHRPGASGPLALGLALDQIDDGVDALLVPGTLARHALADGAEVPAAARGARVAREAEAAGADGAVERVLGDLDVVAVALHEEAHVGGGDVREARVVGVDVDDDDGVVNIRRRRAQLHGDDLVIAVAVAGGVVAAVGDELAIRGAVLLRGEVHDVAHAAVLGQQHDARVDIAARLPAEADEDLVRGEGAVRRDLHVVALVHVKGALQAQLAELGEVLGDERIDAGADGVQGFREVLPAASLENALELPGVCLLIAHDRRDDEAVLVSKIRHARTALDAGHALAIAGGAIEDLDDGLVDVLERSLARVEHDHDREDVALERVEVDGDGLVDAAGGAIAAIAGVAQRTTENA